MMKKDKNPIAGVAQGNKNGVLKRITNKVTSKVKEVPAVERLSTLANKAKYDWKMRAAAAALPVLLLCSPITGCGTDNPMSVSSQNQDLMGKRVAYVNASGELEASEVVAIQGDTLSVSNFYGDGEIHRSEVLGVVASPPTYDTVKFRKGNHLDAYGDMFADIEYLYGSMGRAYKLNGEFTVVDVSLTFGTTASGKEVLFDQELPGESVRVLIYADEYSVMDW